MDPNPTTSRPAPRVNGLAGDEATTGINDERVLLLVFRAVKFDPRLLGVAACVSRRLRAVAKRLLWRELCLSRAPRMAAALACAATGRVGGGWHALAKLLFYCGGCAPSRHFPAAAAARVGHLAGVSRFSKTAGRSFLARRCRGDVLYVSDPCEHEAEEGEDVGIYRGIFRGFMRSTTRAWLVGKGAELEGRVRCPYCGARVWSMTAAGMVPRSAARRLGAREGATEYFVCVSGHLHGACWLAHLSDDDHSSDDDDDDGRIAL